MELSYAICFILCLSSAYDFIIEGGIGMESDINGRLGLVEPMPDPDERRRSLGGEGGSPQRELPRISSTTN